MKTKDKKYRLKVFLIKNEFINSLDEELLKESINNPKYAQYMNKKIDDLDISLFYRKTFDSVPKWYSGYLNQSDKEIYSANASGLFFRKIHYNNNYYRFAITFGSGDLSLKKEIFESKFGIIIALNIGKEFYAIKKQNIAGTMSNSKEQAIKKMELINFQIDFERDLLQGITAKVDENNLFVGNIKGSSSLSFSTTIPINNIDDLLAELIDLYLSTDYKSKYSFIDNITEIKDRPNLKEQIDKEIITKYNENDESSIWFGLPDILDWDKVVDFKFNCAHKESYYNEICFETANDFITNNKLVIDDLQKFKKIKISINTNENYVLEYNWTLLDALYASVEIGDKVYIYSNKRYYEINKDYQYGINKRIQDITIDKNPFKDNQTTKSEAAYLKDISSENENYILVDQQLIKMETMIEPCDIFRANDNAFIHLKKYGGSSVLSHLFSQAYVSAEIFSNSVVGKDKIINKIKELDKNNKYNKSHEKKDYTVIIAIMTIKKIIENQHIDLPFFSKINLVKTIDSIKGLGYKDVRVMYIHSSAPLYNKKTN